MTRKEIQTPNKHIKKILNFVSNQEIVILCHNELSQNVSNSGNQSEISNVGKNMKQCVLYWWSMIWHNHCRKHV